MKETLHIYTRVSTEIQTKGTSLDEQKRIGVKISQDNDLKYEVHNEGGKSSNYETWENRPKIQDIMIGIEEGRIKHLYSYQPDRISRDDIFWNNFRTILIKNNITFYTKDGKYSFDNPTDKLVFSVLSSLGEFDNSLRKIRTHRGKMSKIRQGYWMGGPTPFGYKNVDKKLVENPEESKWVKFIYESFNKGKSIREIREHLFMNGVKTRRNNDRWSLGSIESVLKNDHYKGKYTIHDSSTGTDIECISPKILTTETITKTKKKLVNRSYENRQKSSHQKRDYLLKGFLFCKECGYPYSGRSIHGKRNYFCRKDKFHVIPHKHVNRYLNCEKTDQQIWDIVIETLRNSHTIKEKEKGEILGEKTTLIKTKNRNKRRIKVIDLEISDIKKSIQSIPELKMMTQKEKRDLIKRYDVELLKLSNERESLESQIDEFNTKSEWIDWVSKFEKKLMDEGNKTDKEKKEFLTGVIDRIDVKMESKTKHSLDIHFTHPIVNDRYNPKKQKKTLQGLRTLTVRGLTT